MLPPLRRLRLCLRALDDVLADVREGAQSEAVRAEAGALRKDVDAFALRVDRLIRHEEQALDREQYSPSPSRERRGGY
jgi:hypothetical protein